MKKYPEVLSDVTIEYIDGQVKTFRITASPGIAHYLMSQAAVSGMLVLRNDTEQESLCVPLAQILDVRIRVVADEDGGEDGAEDGGEDKDPERY